MFDSKCQVFVSHAGVPGPEERLWEEWMQKAPDEAAGVLKRDKQITLAEIEATNRVCEPNPMDFPLVIDFLWSDPKGANGYGPSTRVPMVYTFGPDVAQRFLQANNLKYMLRSHETKSAGYQEPKFNPHPTFEFAGISIWNFIFRCWTVLRVIFPVLSSWTVRRQSPMSLPSSARPTTSIVLAIWQLWLCWPIRVETWTNSALSASVISEILPTCLRTTANFAVIHLVVHRKRFSVVLGTLECDPEGSSNSSTNLIQILKVAHTWKANPWRQRRRAAIFAARTWQKIFACWTFWTPAFFVREPLPARSFFLIAPDAPTSNTVQPNYKMLSWKKLVRLSHKLKARFEYHKVITLRS